MSTAIVNAPVADVQPSKTASDHARVQFTVYEPRTPTGKHITKGADGRLIKAKSVAPHDGRAVRRSVASLDEFMRVRAGAAALSYGTFSQDVADLTTTAKQEAGRITRTKGNVRWPAGRGICMVDYDPAGEVLEPQELHAAIVEAVPELLNVTMAWAASASSFIFDAATGHCLEGLKGQRLYFLIEDAREVKDVLVAIHQRLVLRGRGRVIIDGTGRRHIRSLVDTSVAQPERVDFTKLRLASGLEHRPPPVQYFGGGAGGLDVVLGAGVLRPLSGAELAQLEKVEEKLMADGQTVARANEARDQWAERKACEARPNATPEEVAKLKAHFAEGIRSEILYDDVGITLSNGELVRVGDILKEPEKYEGCRCYDPAEPADGNRDNRVAVIERANKGPGWVIYSHLHHGTIYRLEALGFDDVPLDEDARAERRAAQKAENERIQSGDPAPTPRIMTLDQMVAELVWIEDGSRVAFRDRPQHVLSFTDFRSGYAASTTEIATPEQEANTDNDKKLRPKEILTAILWRASPKRVTAKTLTFRAGAGQICKDPDGKDALNLWRPITRHPPTVDVGPFLEHVHHLFGEEAGPFLDWLAHLEQKPGVLPHYGWLHIAQHTGTGRNWLASLFARVWRPYVAPNLDLPGLLSSSFNGQLAGRVLAMVDEAREGGSDKHQHSEKLKSLVNAEYRLVNPKYGREYREVNSTRWLMFSNFNSALPLSNTDRRWRVVRHEAPPLDSAYYRRLYAALDNAAFVNAVGAYLAGRSIAGFNPGERPPMTDAKQAAINASKSPLVMSAEDLIASHPAECITNSEAVRALAPDIAARGGSITTAMRRALEDAGAEQWDKPIKIDGTSERGWYLRNIDKWRQAPRADVAAHIKAARMAEDLF